MKIALTAYALHIGGLETFIFSLARGLVLSGHEVHVVTTDAQGAWFEGMREAGAQPHFIDGAARRSRASHARAVGHYLADAGFDAVINNFSWFVQASLGMLPPETAAVSVIHNSAEEVVSLSCANIAACQAVVAPSPATAELARARVPHHEKVHLIRHGVAISSSPPPRQEALELRVVYCGRLEHRQKGVFLLPEIIRRVSDSGINIHLEVIGDGPDRDKLTGLFQEAGLSSCVEVHGVMNHDQSIERIRQADALILPSFFEGLPLVPLEAMANGSVPVVSLLPGITDFIVGDERSGFLVPPGNAAGFSEALVRLGKDPGLRRSMSVAAWARAQECFSEARMVSDYLALLEKLRSAPPRRAGAGPLAPDMVHWKHWIPSPWLRQMDRFKLTYRRRN